MKRLLSTAIAAVCILLLIPNAVYALNTELSNLTVIMRYGAITLRGIEVTVCRVDTEAFAGAGADFANLTKEKNIALAAALDAYASANQIARSSKVTDSDGKAIFAGLSAGLYLVAQAAVLPEQAGGENSKYTIAPFLAAVHNDVTAYPKTEPIKKDGETISVSAYKIWAGTDSPPASVQVQLYRNGIAQGQPKTLNRGNYWRCVWDDLSPDDTWTVDEINVPDGYVKAVSGGAATGFIITNTKTPYKPEQPSKPNGSNGPKTEDTSDMQLWITLFVISCIGLISVFCIMKIKRPSRAVKRGDAL